ncbi:MAG TPA: hypothetical protein VIL78_20610 [Hanamia sp.]
MKRAEHDALHQLLEPLMGKTKALRNVTTIENAATKYSEIEERINLFAQYFQ